MKRSLIIIALALLVCLAGLVWLGLRPDMPIADSVLDTSQGPAFEVRVGVPRSGLPLGGILPDWVVKKLDGTPRELKIDHTSPGGQIVSVGPNRIEFIAEGWNLLIESDGGGRVAPGTHLVFPLGLGGRQVRLDCRPADHASGYLRTTARAGTERLDGHFLVELAKCKNADSGKAIEWPPAPLTVSGSFADLPPGRPQG